MEKVSVLPYGVVLSMNKGRVVSSGVVGGGEKRGVISRFSSAARLRLRLALLRLFLLFGRRVGVTLTLPWHCEDWSSVMGDFRDVMHRFRVGFLRRFKGEACIYRVELQRRGAPHVHMVSWHHLPLPPDLVDRYFLLWFDSLKRDLRGGSYSDFAVRGVKVDMHINTVGAIRYLCDHESKSKQAQLGYPGKQWGIIGRSFLVEDAGIPVDISDSHLVLLKRFLRKVSRFRVKAPCVFGSRLSRLRRLSKVVYVSSDTINRFLEEINHG